MADRKIEKIDKNFTVKTDTGAPEAVFYDARKAPFRIYGLYEPQAEGQFRRMPADVAAAVSQGVADLSKYTAGGRVRFATDSPYIILRAQMPKLGHLPHMALSGSAGFDLYVDSDDGRASFYRTSFIPAYDAVDGFESRIDFDNPKMRRFTVNFPPYSPVSDLFLGLSPDAAVGEGAPYRPMAPVVYYGSSITQGGCASRPGNIAQNMVCRATGIDYVNLGFSGNGKGEPRMCEYLASLPMSAFICDYDHNAPDAAYLAATYPGLYKTVRAAHPTVPYLMISRPDFHSQKEAAMATSIDRRHAILDTFHAAWESGDKNVYFIDGESIYRGEFEDCCTVDGTHPNDLGFALMAKAITCILRRALLRDELTD